MNEHEKSAADSGSRKQPVVMREPHCHHCGRECEVQKDVVVGGYVSRCHGVGFDYFDENGKEKTENDGLRYISDWDA